jgi:hypothetical protein
MVYAVCIFVMIMDRKFKTFNNNNEWMAESPKQTGRRKQIYTIIKGVKQGLVWANILRGIITGFQHMFMVILLDIIYNNWDKPVLTFSNLLAWLAGAILSGTVCMIGYNLYMMRESEWQTEKLYQKHVRKYYQGIIKPFSEVSNARFINWYDALVKKAFMILSIILLYKMPVMAAMGLTLISGLDIFINARPLIAIPLLNYLRCVEAVGFTMLYGVAMLFGSDILSKDIELSMSYPYAFLMVAILSIGL